MKVFFFKKQFHSLVLIGFTLKVLSIKLFYFKKQLILLTRYKKKPIKKRIIKLHFL